MFLWSPEPEVSEHSTIPQATPNGVAHNSRCTAANSLGLRPLDGEPAGGCMSYEGVEKVGFGADFSRVTIRFCAKSAFRRNADDDGSATACGIALLLLPPGRPDFGRSPLALDRSLRGLQFRAGVAEEFLQL